MAYYFQNYDQPGFSYMDGVPVKISEKYKPPRKVTLPVSFQHRMPVEALTEEYNFTLEKQVLEQAEIWKRRRQAENRAREARLEAERRRVKAKKIKLEAEQKAEFEAEEKVRQERLASQSSTEKEQDENSESEGTKDEGGKQEDTDCERVELQDSTSPGDSDGTGSAQPSPPGKQCTITVEETKPAYDCHNGILTPTPFASPRTGVTYRQHTATQNVNFADFEGDSSSPFDNLELKTINDMEELASVLQPKQAVVQYSKNIKNGNIVNANNEAMYEYGVYSAVGSKVQQYTDKFSLNNRSSCKDPTLTNVNGCINYSPYGTIPRQYPNNIINGNQPNNMDGNYGGISYSTSAYPQSVQITSADSSYNYYTSFRWTSVPYSGNLQTSLTGNNSHYQSNVNDGTDMKLGFSYSMSGTGASQSLPRGVSNHSGVTGASGSADQSQGSSLLTGQTSKPSVTTTWSALHPMSSVDEKPKEELPNFYSPYYNIHNENSASDSAYGACAVVGTPPRHLGMLHSSIGSQSSGMTKMRSSKSVPDLMQELERELDKQHLSDSEKRKAQYTPPPRPPSTGPVGMEDWKPWPVLDSPSQTHPKVVASSTGGQDISEAASTGRRLDIPESHPEASEMKLPDPFLELSPESQALVRHISEMGFPQDRVARACQKLKADDKKMIEHLLQVQLLQEKGYPGDRTETALFLYDHNETEAMTHLELTGQFLDYGFSEEEITKALVMHNNNRDKTLDFLLS